MSKNHSTNKERSHAARKIANVQKHLKAEQKRKRAKEIKKLREYWHGEIESYPL